MKKKYRLMHQLKKAKATALLGVSLFLTSGGYAQTNLKSLLDKAGNYPSIAAKRAHAEASRQNVSLERNAALPSLDAAYQANLATYNNITGMTFPGMLMPISGPPTTGNNYDPVPGSAASLLFKWSPVTFGQRAAAVEQNRNLYERDLALVEDETLRIKFKAGFMYLDIAATSELIRAYEKNIEKSEFNLRQAHSLVTAGIRPSVDSLRLKGELSKAKTELYKLENLLQNQELELRELLGMENAFEIQPDPFLFENLPSLPMIGDSGSGKNPLLKAAQYDVEANKALLKQVNRSWTPDLEFWGTAYARGSGINSDGETNVSDGWTFSRYNYGVGVQLVFPLLDLSNVKLKSMRQEAFLQSSEEQLKQARISLQKQDNVSVNDLSASIRIANESPVEYEASRAAYEALQTRYNAGLVDYTELIQAQYDLLHAESGLKTAYIDSWKSLLKLAMVRGDLNIFLQQIQN